MKFRKGGSSSPTRTPDTITSNDYVEVLLGISEGPIKGLKEGPKSFLLDNTALVSPAGTANFPNFNLQFWPGSLAGHTIKMDLGGFSTPMSVSVPLASGVPVTRSGLVTGIDAADFRIVINQLVKSNDKGTFTLPLSIKFEYKPHSSGSWLPAWVSDVSDDFTGDLSADGSYKDWSQFGTDTNVQSFRNDRKVTVGSGAPATPGTATSNLYIRYDNNTFYSWLLIGWGVASYVNHTGYKTVTLSNGDHVNVWDVSSTPPSAPTVGDIWRNTTTTALVWNGVTWTDPGIAEASAPAGVDGVWSVDAKVTSATPKDLRVFLPVINEPYDFRVTKLSPDTTTENFCDITWESIQEIQRSPMTFHGVSMVKVLGRASDQFTSLPTWNGIYQGRIVKVPSNYNAETRTYTGIWDGTYTLAYTNNPAFVFQDFVENETYGLSSVFPHTVNKWTIYEWGVYCDEPVARPGGGTRPRWTFNDWISEPRPAREMAQYIAGCAGATYIDNGDGEVTVVIDRDDPAVMLFTPENVSDEGFNYTYTDRLTRANEVIVEFVNPDLNWENDHRVVRDEDDIATYGRISDPFVAVGCTDVDEAIARARYRLINGLTQKETVSFTTNRKGIFLSEWDVILVSDPNMGRGISRRIHAKTSSTTVSLRDPVTLEPGITYTATFEVVNPDYPATSDQPYTLEQRTVTTGAGSQTNLTFATALPDLPEYAAFTLEAENFTGYPKPYRIIAISDDDGGGERIKIQALELNRNKYTYVDTGEDQGPITYSTLASAPVLPVTNPAIVPGTRVVGTNTLRTLTLSWERSSSPWVRTYRVYHNVNGSLVRTYQTEDNSIEIEGASTGIQEFVIVAISIQGMQSTPVTFLYDVTGTVRPVNAPTNLRIDGGLTSSTFDTLSPTFAWDAATADPNFSYYEVQVRTSPGGSLIRTVNVGQALSWTYDFQNQKTDNAGTPQRTFSVYVRAVDQDGNKSDPISLTVTNAAPAAPTLTVTPGLGGVNVKLSAPAERDVAGALVWVSSSTGFNPLLVAATVDADQQSFWFPASVTQYVRAAYYDSFSKTPSGLNITTEVSATPTAVTIDTTPPAVPTGLAVSSSLALDTNGDQIVMLNVSWAAVADADLDYYDLAIQQGAGSFISYPTSGTSYSLRVPANTSFTVKIRAVDGTGNKSAYSGTQSTTTTQDSSAPSAPTGFTAQASFTAIFLSWTNPTASDLARVEVWSNTTNNSGTATRLATVNAASTQAGGFTHAGLATGVTRYYWLKAVDTSGNTSGFSSVANATTGSVGTSDLSSTAPSTPTLPSLTSSVTVNPDGSQIVQLTFSFTGVSDTDLASYVVALQEAAGTFREYNIGTSTSTNFVVKGNVSYTAKVLAVNKLGVRGSFSTTATVTSATDSTVPSAPTALSATAAITSIFLDWLNPTAADLKSVEIWMNTSNNTGTASRIATVDALSGAPNSFTHSGLTTGVTRYYWVKAVDTSGNTSGFSSAANATVSSVTNSDIAAATITGAKIAAGTLTASHIAAGTITATEIAAGTITGALIAADTLTAKNLNIGQRGIDIAGLEFRHNWNGSAITTNTLYWSAGTISYVNDAGTPTTASISSGTVAWASGTTYIYWIKGGTALSTTSTQATAYGANNIVLATYRGGVDLVAIYGRTWIDGSKIQTGTITAAQIAAGTITASEIAAGTITGSLIAAGTITASNIQAGTLTGDRFNTSTSLPGTITVGVTGVSIGTIQTQASDPLTRANTQSTTLNPGLVLISGATTLANWRNGSDNTKIEGGSIAANTVSANAITIGSRGIDIIGLEFQHNWNGSAATTNTLYWSAGTISYVNDSGTPTTAAISSSTVAWTSGTIYVYWVKGAGTLSTTTTQATAYGANNIVLATYQGGTNLVANYGRTIIDGSKITAGSITATQIAAATITGALIAAGTITAGNIAAGTITATELAAGSVTATKINVSTLSAISADLGTVTAGTLSVGTGGVTIQSGSSGARIVMSNSKIEVYDSGGTLRVRLGLW